MTFQVSDTDLQTREVRRQALKHGLLSYLFGTVIVATSIESGSSGTPSAPRVASPRALPPSRGRAGPAGKVSRIEPSFVFGAWASLRAR